jgi:hypothetical protein
MTWAATLFLLAVPVFGASDPKARLESIDRHLHKGEWEAAAQDAREAAAAACKSPFGRDLALPAARLAVAEAGLGREADAVWHWHVAQNLDPSPLSRDALRAFGPPGELLERNRLRPAGQPPAGLDVWTVANLHLRRLQGSDPKLSPEVQALPVPKWLRVQLVVDAAGRPRDPVVLGGGLPGMTWQVLEAVRDWRFEPREVDGRPTPVFYQLSINSPAGKPLADMVPADPLLTDVEALLRRGAWKEAEKKASGSWPRILGQASLGRPGLAAALALRALADAGDGQEAEAVCRWQAAQTVSTEIYHADLSAYGAPGALLARNRWGDAMPELADREAGVREPTLGKHAMPKSLPWNRVIGSGLLVAGVIDERGGLRQPVALLARMQPPAVSQEVLEASALEAVCGWSFHPAMAGGRPVAVAQTISFLFAPSPQAGVAAGLRPPAWTPPLSPSQTPPARPWQTH